LKTRDRNTKAMSDGCPNAMETKDKKNLIENFILSYNSFDVDGMMALMHPECSFQNISDG
jgi:hypothetical protein